MDRRQEATGRSRHSRNDSVSDDRGPCPEMAGAVLYNTLYLLGNRFSELLQHHFHKEDGPMKVAYLLESGNVREILENMIIPQLEEDRHGVEVAGMMFFFDNCYMLVEGSDIAERL